jgi:hypothetical protein
MRGFSMDQEGGPKNGHATKAVVASKVVSKQGARVTETVFVLSRNASLRLQIKGELPERQKAAS